VLPVAAALAYNNDGLDWLALPNRLPAWAVPWF
jgi:hypothetical protein